MRPEGDRQCLMRFVSDIDLFSFLCKHQAKQITLEDVSFTNWTAQRSAEQESEMGYLARIRKGEAKGAMDSTITTIEKTRHHSHPLEAPRQAGGEKVPCVRNEPIIGIRLRASAREDNHDIPPCTLEPPPAERGDFDASIHTLVPLSQNGR
jgi:hypothetical protein